MSPLSRQQCDSTDSAFTPAARSRVSHEVGRRDSENSTSMERHPTSTSSVADAEPVLDIHSCFSPATAASDATFGTVSSVHDTRNISSTGDTLPSEVSEFTEQITRARSGLMSASRHTAALQLPSRVAEVNLETDSHWGRISLRVNQMTQLKIRDLDFSDLVSEDDSVHRLLSDSCTVTWGTVPTPPPPPPTFVIPPPPLFGDAIAPPPPPPSLSTPTSSTVKTRKTMKLHWKEAKPDVRSVFGSPATETIWTEMSRESGPVKIDCNKLEHLFETRTVDVKSKVINACLVVVF